MSKRIFTLSPDDLKALYDAAQTARSTPVVLIGGVDLSARAHEGVNDVWQRMGKKYGFDWETAGPAGTGNDADVLAEPVTPKALPPVDRIDNTKEVK